MAGKGAVFQDPQGFFQPFQSGVNKLFSGPAGARPDPSSFIQYGAGNVIPSAATGLAASAGKPTVQHTQKFDSSGYKRAEDHWLRMKELDAQKQKIFSDLRAYGAKDLSPDAPSHEYAGEAAGEYEPQDMGLSDTYLDILNPGKYEDYDEFERERDNMFTYSGLV